MALGSALRIAHSGRWIVEIHSPQLYGRGAGYKELQAIVNCGDAANAN